MISLPARNVAAHKIVLMPGEAAGKVIREGKGVGKALNAAEGKRLLWFQWSRSDSFLSLRIYSAAFSYQ